jgi:hypothetical protein
MITNIHTNCMGTISFGDTALEAMAELAKSLNFRASKI